MRTRAPIRRFVSSISGFFDMTTVPPVTLTAPPEPSEQECDRALGAFLRSWDQVQHAIGELLIRLTESNPRSGNILSESIWDWRTQRTIIEAVGHDRLSATDYKKLSDLTESLHKANTRRNRIVHGKWAIIISVHKDDSGKTRAIVGKWVRADWPADMKEVFDDKEYRKDYELNVQQIINITNSSRSLAREISAFAKAISLNPFVPAKPIDIS